MPIGYTALGMYNSFRPELWTPRVTRFFREKLYAANFFRDYSSDVMNADVVHIPHFEDTTTVETSIATTNGAVTGVTMNDTKTDLTVDTWEGAAVYITKFEEREIMKRPNVIDEYASYLGYRCGKNAETAILANLTSLSSSTGDSAHTIYSTNIEQAFGILESYSVPREECRIFIKPKIYWRQIMSIQKYYDASQFGRATLPFGVHDQLYGVNVTFTNCLTPNGLDAGTVIVHPGAVAFAMYGPDLTVTKGEDLRKKVIADVMYGDVILQRKWGVQIHSSNSL